MTADSYFSILGISQKRNNHTALGTLLGLQKEVSTRSSLEVSIAKGQGDSRTSAAFGGPYRDIKVSAENTAKDKIATSVGHMK